MPEGQKFEFVEEVPTYFEEVVEGREADLLHEVTPLLKEHCVRMGWNPHLISLVNEIAKQSMLMVINNQHLDLRKVSAQSILPLMLEELNKATEVVEKTVSVPIERQARSAFGEETGSIRKGENRRAAQARVGGPGA